MAASSREFVPNQVFVGLPWKNVRPKYERISAKLNSKFPLHFSIVGRGDGQEATDLFELIKTRIDASSWAIFDATTGNANVSLEYGYAEGIDVPRSIYLSTHKSAQGKLEAPIIADLGGRRRVEYKTEKSLVFALTRFCKEHDYTKRFEKALAAAAKKLKKGQKKRARTLALKLVHALDGQVQIRRAELVQRLQAVGYTEDEVDSMLKKLHSAAIINCSVGRNSTVRIA